MGSEALMREDMDCPGCGREGIPRHMVACSECWHRMPQAIKMPIRQTNPGGFARLRAIYKAREWLIANKRKR